MNIGRSAIYNFAGGVLPALVSLATIPIIVHGLGHTGYGLFTLVTAIVGYFAIIDINVTAGTVKFIAEYAAKNNWRGVDQTFTIGFLIYLAIGLTGALAIFIAAPALIRGVFSVPESLFDLGQRSLRIAAVGFFFGQIHFYFVGVPASLLRYDLNSRIETIFGVLVPLTTVGILAAGYGLIEVIAFRVLATAANCVVFWIIIHRLLPNLRFVRPEPRLVRNLLEFSAFSFLTRLAGLTYNYGDKLIIGALVGMKELAYYAVAANFANRALGFTFRLSAVLFPATAKLAAIGEHERLHALYLKANRYVGFINGSILVLVVVFAEPILYYWMNPEFARNGALILALVAIGMYVDSLTTIPSLVNDALGHPRLSGIFALVRACVGLIAVYVLVSLQGIEGAAWAHFATSSFATIGFIFLVHDRTVPCKVSELFEHSYALPVTILLGVAGVSAYLVHAAQFHPVALGATLTLTLALLFVLGVSAVLSSEDRRRALRGARYLLSKSN